MKRYKLSLSSNPSFNTVTGLTNTTFDSINYVENRMATEQQISDLYNRIVEEEKRRDYCCRDVIIWEAHTQIVRLNNNSTTYNKTNEWFFNSGGTVVSSFDENVNIGTMRRGLKYTVTFPIKWDSELYYPVTLERYDNANCNYFTFGANDGVKLNNFHKHIQFRYLEDEDNIWGNNRCSSTTNNRKDFFIGVDSGGTSVGNVRGAGKLVNAGSDWGPFIRNVENDGTVKITDLRNNVNFNIIRFYTQFTLNRCANGSLLSNKESQIFINGRPDIW